MDIYVVPVFISVLHVFTSFSLSIIVPNDSSLIPVTITPLISGNMVHINISVNVRYTKIDISTIYVNNYVQDVKCKQYNLLYTILQNAVVAQ